MAEGPKCDCSCSCDNAYGYNHSSSTLLPPFSVTTSEFTVSLKEIVILSMILFLLLYSIFAFLKHWKRNYYDISSSCQFNSQINDSGATAIQINYSFQARGQIRIHFYILFILPLWSKEVQMFLLYSINAAPRRDRAPGLGGGGASQQGGEPDVKDCQGKRQK